MPKKTTIFSRKGISDLPNGTPALYKIQTESGKTNYAGVAKRGRVQERVAEHLLGAKDPVPGAKVQIQQFDSIAAAREMEQRVIARSKPKYNKQGK